MSDENESVLVKLTRMEGKLDLSNLRHDQTDAWKATVDQRLNSHRNDISSLQHANILREGERKGIGLIVKGGYLLGGSGIMGLVAIVARHFGV